MTGFAPDIGPDRLARGVGRLVLEDHHGSDGLARLVEPELHAVDSLVRLDGMRCARDDPLLRAMRSDPGYGLEDPPITVPGITIVGDGQPLYRRCGRLLARGQGLLVDAGKDLDDVPVLAKRDHRDLAREVRFVRDLQRQP